MACWYYSCDLVPTSLGKYRKVRPYSYRVTRKLNLWTCRLQSNIGPSAGRESEDRELRGEHVNEKATVPHSPHVRVLKLQGIPIFFLLLLSPSDASSIALTSLCRGRPRCATDVTETHACKEKVKCYCQTFLCIACWCSSLQTLDYRVRLAPSRKPSSAQRVRLLS